MKKLLWTVVLMGAMAVPGAARAQISLGGGAAFHDDFDFGILAFGRFALPDVHENISVAPSFVYYFPEGDVTIWELNGDVIYSFPVGDDTPVLPFAFAGLNILRISSDEVTVPGFGTVGGSNTEIGLNLGGGVQFRAESLNPFAGAKFEIQDGSGFVIFGGVGFPLG